MNERIKELAQQAGLLPKDIGPVVDTRHMKKKEQDLEMFAELIVRECMTKVSEWDIGIDDPVGATDNTSEVARDIVAEIKKHFGV